MAGVNDPLPSRPRGRRGPHPGWWLLLLALAACGWAGWREYDHRAAIRETEAAGFVWEVREPFILIRADWRAAFHKATWTGNYRSLSVGAGRDLASLRPLLLRLRPTTLSGRAFKDANLDTLQGLTGLQTLDLSYSPTLQNANALQGLSGLQCLDLSGCTTLQNVDGLKGLSRLERLHLINCPSLQNVDGLMGLTGLQHLHLSGCTGLKNVDGLRGLTGLQTLYLSGCSSLQNVDGLKGLVSLQEINLGNCPKLPKKAVTELRAALPTTTITGYDPD